MIYFKQAEVPFNLNSQLLDTPKTYVPLLNHQGHLARLAIAVVHGFYSWVGLLIKLIKWATWIAPFNILSASLRESGFRSLELQSSKSYDQIYGIFSNRTLSPSSRRQSSGMAILFWDGLLDSTYQQPERWYLMCDNGGSHSQRIITPL